MDMRKTFTMTLNTDLMREAKKRAIDLEVPLYQFVEEAVRAALGVNHSSLPKERYDSEDIKPETGHSV